MKTETPQQEKEVSPQYDNDKFYKLITDALEDRNEFETKIAKFNFQRYGRDRPKNNTRPWPGASNYRRKKSDEIIEQKKAFYSQIIHASQVIANFRPMVPSNTNYATLAEAYFDYVIKELTDFEIRLIYTLDSGLEAGFSFMKVMWDVDNQVPKFEWIDNLFVIVPGRSLHIEECPWVVHVVQMGKDEAIEKYGKLPGFKNLIKGAMSPDTNTLENDNNNLSDDRYQRKGINISTFNRFVVWELHYQDQPEMVDDKVKKRYRMRTICPSDPKFDFQDDKPYPYTRSDGNQEIMIKQYRREWLTPDIYSPRGIPEIAWEEEYLLTSLARLKHNYMTFAVNPAFTSENGLSTTNTQNISFAPGFVLPGDLKPIQFPPPPVSMDAETQNVESIVDRRMNASSSSTGPNTIYTGGEGNKTAREISYKASLQSMAVNYESMPFKKFMRQVLRYAWELMIQPDNKPSTFDFYLNNTIQQLPVEALNGSYNIVLSWSVDNINKEFNIQQAGMLWQASINNPYANAPEAWKNYVDQLVPGQGNRFIANPQALQADAIESISNEIDTMVSTGFPVRPKESTDHYLAVGTTIQFIQNEQQRGQPIPQDRKYLLDRYMAAHREMLKKSDPKKYEMLNQQLNAMDISARQQMAQQQAAQQAQQGGAAQQLQNQLVGMRAQQVAGIGQPMTNGVAQ